MAFSKRQLKRLNDMASMIKNARTIADEFDERNSEYEYELNSLIERIKQDSQPSMIPGKNRGKTTPSPKRKPFRRNIKQKPIQAYNKFAENYFQTDVESESNPDVESNKNIPNWAKEVWRKIMLFCHPDRQTDDLSEDEIRFRQSILMNTMKNYKEEDWEEILYSGILISQYTEKLSQKNQLKNLGKLYTGVTKRIETIQNSHSWLWGINWDSVNVRLRILVTYLSHNKIKIPPEGDLIKLIDDLEAE